MCIENISLSKYRHTDTHKHYQHSAAPQALTQIGVSYVAPLNRELVRTLSARNNLHYNLTRFAIDSICGRFWPLRFGPFSLCRLQIQPIITCIWFTYYHTLRINWPLWRTPTLPTESPLCDLWAFRFGIQTHTPHTQRTPCPSSA